MKDLSRSTWFTLAVISFLLAAAFFIKAAYGQVTYIAIDKGDPNDTLAFDWGGLDVSGNPVELELVEFVFRVHPPPSPGPPPIRLPTSGMIKVGENEYLARTVVADLPLGRYSLHVRGKNRTGIFSEEGNELLVEVLSKKPAVLLRLRHVVKP